jgi:alpha-1,3-rhamnosyltransferase
MSGVAGTVGQECQGGIKPAMMPLVSVIMASYNHDGYVAESVLSIVNQSYAHLEIIVIDDGSTDNSPTLLSELSAEYGFRLIRQANSGIARTFNLGISLAKGKYICLTSSDDVWTKEKIRTQVEFMENNPDVAVCGGRAKLMNEKREVMDINWFGYSGVLTFDKLFIFGERLPAFTAMIRSDVLADVGSYDPALLVEDLAMWLKIAHKGYPIVLLDNLLGYYRVHPTNLHKDIVLMNENIERILLKYKSEPSYGLAVNQYYLRNFCAFCLQDKKAAFRFLMKYRFSMLNIRMFLTSLILFLVPAKPYRFMKGVVLKGKMW